MNLRFDTALSDPERAIIREEWEILHRLREFLAAFTPRWRDLQVDEDMLALRDSLGEAREDEVAQIVAQMDSLASLSTHRRQQRELPEAPLDLESPYFGHLRVRQDGRVRDVLIGSRTLTAARIPYPIIDWRHAPISRVFYCYGEGDEYVETFAGKEVEGEIIALRKVLVLKGQLVRIDCPQGVFQLAKERWVRLTVERPRLHGGAGTALRPESVGPVALGVGADGARADRHLPAITGLIDAEQFALITRPDSGIVVIDGGAGTGKTTIALHRVAYLAFRDPERFRPEQVMVVVFSVPLARYISHLLPALGVKGVAIEAQEEFFAGLRRRHFPDLRVDYAEATPAQVMRFKQHPAVWTYLEERSAAWEADFRRGLADALSGIAGGERALGAWDALADLPLAVRQGQFALWVRGKAIVPGVGGFGDDWLARQRLQNHLDLVLPAPDRPHAVAERIWEEAFLSLDRLRAALDRLAPGQFAPAHLEEVRNWAFRYYSEHEEHRAYVAEKHGPRERDEEDDEDAREPQTVDLPRMDREDDALLLLLHRRVVGPLRGAKKRPLSLAHLVVDEAQDFGPLELRVLLGLAADPPSVTLAGDTEQRMILHNSFTRWEDVLDQLGLRGTAISPLKVGYRSTEAIMEFSRAVLGPLSTDRPWLPTRGGAPVDLLRFADPGQAVAVLSDALRALLRAEPNAAVALIARTPERADLYCQGLARTDLPRLRRVAEQNFSFQPGIEVTDISQVKGLEYDYVVLLDVDDATYPDDTASRYLLHVGATRAAHQLWLVTCRAPSPLLPAHLVTHLM